MVPDAIVMKYAPVVVALLALAGMMDMSAAAGGLSLSSVRQPSPLFERLDTDRDGYVSRSEAELQPGLLQAFDAADTAQIGMLDAVSFRRAQALYERAQVAAFVGDSAITARVKAALARESASGRSRVEVRTRDGIVLLSGHADSAHQAERALAIAATADGVKAVRSEIVVGSQGGPA